MRPPGNAKSKEQKRLRRRNAPTRPRHNRAPSETPPPKKQVAPNASTNKVWENIVIHYLNKLRSAWRPTPKNPANPKPGPSDLCLRTRATRATRMAAPSPDPCISVDQMSVDAASVSQTSVATATSVENSKAKAMNIVTNALEYGQAKGLISKNGKFFWLRDEKSLPGIGRRLGRTPSKDCDAYRKEATKVRSPRASASLTTVSSEEPRGRLKNYLSGAATKRPGAFKKYRKRVRKLRYSSDSDCSCSKCRNKKR